MDDFANRRDPRLPAAHTTPSNPVKVEDQVLPFAEAQQMQAAYTAPGDYPAYINAQRGSGTVTVRVRTAGYYAGSEIVMSLETFRQWLAEAHAVAA